MSNYVDRYRVVGGVSAETLEQAVNSLIDHGWIPVGGVFFRESFSGAFLQAVYFPFSSKEVVHENYDPKS